MRTTLCSVLVASVTALALPAPPADARDVTPQTGTWTAPFTGQSRTSDPPAFRFRVSRRSGQTTITLIQLNMVRSCGNPDPAGAPIRDVVRTTFRRKIKVGTNGSFRYSRSDDPLEFRGRFTSSRRMTGRLFLDAGGITCVLIEDSFVGRPLR